MDPPVEIIVEKAPDALVTEPLKAGDKACGICGPENTGPTTTVHESCTCDADSFKVTVKFKLDEKHIIAQVYDNHILLKDMLLDLAPKFKVDQQYMRLQHEYMELKDEQQLRELPRNEFSIVELDLSLNAKADEFNKNCRYRHELLCLDPEVFYEHYHLPELLMVHITDEKDRNLVAKRLIVEIVSKPIVKSFVGGFRDTRTSK